jgi:hypothetical protein
MECVCVCVCACVRARARVHLKPLQHKICFCTHKCLTAKNVNKNTVYWNGVQLGFNRLFNHQHKYFIYWFVWLRYKHTVPVCKHHKTKTHWECENEVSLIPHLGCRRKLICTRETPTNLTPGKELLNPTLLSLARIAWGSSIPELSMLSQKFIPFVHLCYFNLRQATQRWIMSGSLLNLWSRSSSK